MYIDGNLEAINHITSYILSNNQEKLQRLRLCYKFMKIVSEVGIFSRSSSALWLLGDQLRVRDEILSWRKQKNPKALFLFSPQFNFTTEKEAFGSVFASTEDSISSSGFALYFRGQQYNTFSQKIRSKTHQSSSNVNKYYIDFFVIRIKNEFRIFPGHP